MMVAFVKNKQKYLKWAKNIFAAIYNRALTILIQLITLPILLKYFGKNSYAEWLLLTSIPAYLSTSDLGINVTVTTKICSLVAQSKYEEALQLYKSANRLFLIISLFGFFIVTILIYFISWKSFLNISQFNLNEVRLSLLFLSLGMFIAPILGLCQGIFKSEGRLDLFQNSITLQQLVEAIISTVLLVFTKNIVIVSISFIVIKILFLGFTVYFLENKYLWYRFGTKSELNHSLKLVPVSVHYMIALIGQSLFIQGPVLLIGKYLGTSSLIIFTTSRTLTNAGKSIASIFYSSFVVDYTYKLAKKEFSEASKLFNKVLLITSFGSFFITVFLLFFGPELIKIWTKREVYVDTFFFNILCISSIFSTINNCCYSILSSTNQNKNIGLFYLFSSVILLVLMSLFYRKSLEIYAFLILIIEFLQLLAAYIESKRVLKGNRILFQ